MSDIELFSLRVFPHLAATGKWVIAFEEDGMYYTDSYPQSDFYVPVPDAYATREGAEAAIEVLKAWEAPVADEQDCLTMADLYRTPQWAALVPHLPGASIGRYPADDYAQDQLMHARVLTMTFGTQLRD